MAFPRASAFGLAWLALPLLSCGEEEPARVILGCRIDEVRSVAADESPLGFSARQVLEHAGVRGDLTFDFGTESRPGPSVPLEVGIDEADLAHVEWVRESRWVGGGDERPACPQALTLPATVIVRTSDGRFDERLAVQVWAVAADASGWEAELALADFGGSFQVEWPLPWSPARPGDTVPRSVWFRGNVDPETGSWGSAWVLADGPRSGHHASLLGDWGVAPDPP